MVDGIVAFKRDLKAQDFFHDNHLRLATPDDAPEVAQLAARIATTAAASGGAAGGAAAAGAGGGTAVAPGVGTVIGLAGGFLVGALVDWWMTDEFEEEVARQCHEFLGSTKASLLEGDQGLKQIMLQQVEHAAGAYEEAVQQSLKPPVET